MIKPLYEIESDLLKLIQRLDQKKDPLEYELIMNQVDLLVIDKSVKLKGCCEYVQWLDNEQSYIQHEIDRLKRKKEKVLKRKESFLNYMASCLPNREKWKSGMYEISRRQSESVEITDQALIPPQYLKEKISYEPDKITAKHDIKMGAVIPGMQLVTKQNIQIK